MSPPKDEAGEAAMMVGAEIPVAAVAPTPSDAARSVGKGPEVDTTEALVSDLT